MDQDFHVKLTHELCKDVYMLAQGDGVVILRWRDEKSIFHYWMMIQTEDELGLCKLNTTILFNVNLLGDDVVSKPYADRAYYVASKIMEGIKRNA